VKSLKLFGGAKPGATVRPRGRIAFVYENKRGAKCQLLTTAEATEDSAKAVRRMKLSHVETQSLAREH